MATPEVEAMSITITDSEFLTRLAQMRGMVELKDPDRNTVGRIQTMWPEPVPPWGRFHFVDRVSDPQLLATFAHVTEPVEVFDPDGKLIGRFERTWEGKPPVGFKSPLTDEEFEKRRKEARSQKGYTLAEVWKIIYEKYVGDDVEPFIVDGREPVG
jgi:hypothetical protein